jgi:hypothetical protein
MTTPSERDVPAEQDYAEWRGWMEAQDYHFDDDSYQAEAFAAGMQAQRDLDAATSASSELATLLADWRRTADSLKDRHGAGDARERNTLEVVIGQVEAILADAVTPTAEDFDHAADVMRLRDLITEVLDSYEATDDRGPATQVQIAKWRGKAEGRSS